MSESKSGVISSIKPSKIIGLQFSILSPDEIRKSSVAEITSRDTYVNNNPVIGGLFDPRMGVNEPGLICPTDGLNYMQTPGYFGHIELAKPVFYIQYLSTVIKILRCTCLKCGKLLINKELDFNTTDSRKRWLKIFSVASKVKRCGEENDDGCGTRQPDKIYKEGLATIYAEWKPDKDEGSEISLKKKLTPEIVLKIFNRMTDDDIDYMGFNHVWSHPSWMICQVLAVPPPAVRPSIKHDSQQRSEDDVSHIIVNIIKTNKSLQEKVQDNAPSKVIDDWSTVLQYYVATMIDNKIPGVAPNSQRSGRPLKSIKERLVGKTGRVRGNLMGKRVDYSARSVIGPDVNLKISELGVPKKIAMNVTYPEKVNIRNKRFLTKLVLNGPDEYPGAKILKRKNGEEVSLRYVDRKSIELNEGDIVHRHMMDGDAVLFNRQPTLHRMSMMGHIVKVMNEGNTFRLNVGVTKPYNADFDGDEMNLHMPQDEEAMAELRNLAAVPRQIISPANNQSIIGVFQDSLLGAFRFTRKGINFSSRQAMNLLMDSKDVNPEIFKDGEVSNFNILSQILPPMSVRFPNKLFEDTENKKMSNNVIEIENGEYIRGHMEKGTLGASSKGLIQSIYNNFGYKASADFIDNLQSIVNQYMTTSAYSVGISDLIADKNTNDKIITTITGKKQDVKNIIDQTLVGVFENNTGKTNEQEFETQVNNILNKAQEEAGKIGRKSLSENNRFKIMVNAGSKGSNINIAQMISCLGQQNVDGKRIPYGFEDRTLPHYNKYDDSPVARGFVESSFVQGLTPQEMFFHAMTGRVGLIDTAVKTSQTGYIQRRLIKGMEDIKVEYDMTVRNNMNKIIQFEYGDDGIETTRVEGQPIPLVKMSIEEVYAHYQIPQDVLTTADESSINYTKDAVKRMKKQKEETVKKTKEIIEYMLDMRDDIVTYVFNNEDLLKVYVPVNFTRILNNVEKQLHIQSNSMVDITPLEVYNMTDYAFDQLYKGSYMKPTELMKVLFMYYLSPKELLLVRKFNKNAISLVLEMIDAEFKKAIVNPGEMVGMIAAQSIGEPTTQMTLNTFHFAGVASKSNVTRGVPRIEELLSLSSRPKNPSLTVYLKPEDETNKQKAQEMMYMLEHTKLKDITKKVEICFDPDDLETLIEKDTELMEEYREFQEMVEECGENVGGEKKYSKWIIRFEMDRESMLDRNITMDDVYYVLNNSYKEEIKCVYSDFNHDNLVMRIRMPDVLSKKKGLGYAKQHPLDQTDEIYMLKNIQDNMLNNIVLRGVKNIGKVNMRKITNDLTYKDDRYVPQEIWVLDTVGTNLMDILALETIDKNKTFSNDIIEVHNVLGIEAARQIIYNELAEVIEFDGTYINYHHMALLCDRMTITPNMVSIYRHGINNDHIGPIAKASFEETPEMFLRAARHAELDPMKGVSANVMCGQQGHFGTNSFQVLLNVESMNEIGTRELEEEQKVEFKMEDPEEVCSTQNIVLTNTTQYIKETNIGDIDDDYNPGF